MSDFNSQEKPSLGVFFQEKDSEIHRGLWVERNLKFIQFQLPATSRDTSHQSRLLQVPSHLAMNVFI